MSLSNCSDPSANGTANLSGSINFTSQTGSTLTGSMTLTACDAAGIEGCYTVTVPIAGTMATPTNGCFEYNTGQMQTRWCWTVSGNTITITISGSVNADGITCGVGGSLVLTRR